MEVPAPGNVSICHKQHCSTVWPLAGTATGLRDTSVITKCTDNEVNCERIHNKERILSYSLNRVKCWSVALYYAIEKLLVSYGCEAWSLTLRDVHRLRVLKNILLRNIFGSKSDEVTGEWRRLQNEELCALYSSPNIIRVIKSRRMRRAGHVACMGDRRGAYRVLVRTPREGDH